MLKSDCIIQFISALYFDSHLPKGIQVLNPFRDNSEILPIAKEFYQKFYNDNSTRTLILGINPGRLGAGATGIPFTDTKRMKEKCGIEINGFQTHEPSSVFVYEVIDAFGGAKKFYSEYYISSICPLGFTATSKAGKEVNYNYYDSKELTTLMKPFIIESMNTQLQFGLNREVVFCFGTGKNFNFIQSLNEEMKWFGKVIPLEHPRYIMQYKSKRKEDYVTKYLEAFAAISD